MAGSVFGWNCFRISSPTPAIPATGPMVGFGRMGDEKREMLAMQSDAGNQLLTLKQAAEFLHVSRRHLLELLAAGELGTVARTGGGHRRISKARVMSFKTKQKRAQLRALKSLTETSARLGLYDWEANGVPRRAVRK